MPNLETQTAASPVGDTTESAPFFPGETPEIKANIDAHNEDVGQMMRLKGILEECVADGAMTQDTADKIFEQTYGLDGGVAAAQNKAVENFPTRENTTASDLLTASPADYANLTKLVVGEQTSAQANSQEVVPPVSTGGDSGWANPA